MAATAVPSATYHLETSGGVGSPVARSDALAGQLARAVVRRGERAVEQAVPAPCDPERLPCGVLQRQFDVASATRDWSTLDKIKRSSGGKTSGVLFATDTTGHRLVVKFLDDGAGPTFADRLIQGLGIATPASRVLATAEAKTAKRAIKGRRADLADKSQRDELEQHLKAPFVQIQEFANATAFDALTSQDRLRVLGDRTAMRTVGMLAMADAFMANYDRVTRTQCNLGNLMLTPGGVVVAIDNDARFDPGSTSVAIQDIDFLLSAGGAKSLSSTFLSAMTRHMAPSDALKVDFDDVETWIGEGIMEGAVGVSNFVTPTVMSEAENLELVDMPVKRKNRRMRWREMHTRLTRIREKALALIG